MTYRKRVELGRTCLIPETLDSEPCKSTGTAHLHKYRAKGFFDSRTGLKT